MWEGKLSQRKVIITGAGGQIGQMLRHIWRFGEAPDGLQTLFAGRCPPTAEAPLWDMAWNLGEDVPEALSQGDIVLHLAGCLRGSDAELAQNTAIVPPLLEACHTRKVAHLFYVSTAGVYRPSAEPASEEDPLAPPSAYGRSKAAAEALLPPSTAALGVTILRLGNVAGADALLRPRPAGDVIRLDPVTLGDPEDRGPLRSWISPFALASAIAVLIEQAAAGAPLPRILNIAQTPPLPMRDLLDAIGSAWSWSDRPAPIPTAIQDCRKLEAICPLPALAAAGLVADVLAYRGLQSRVSGQIKGQTP